MPKKFIIFISFVLSCTYDSIYCPECPSYQSPSFILASRFFKDNDTIELPLTIDLKPNDTINYLNYYRYREIGFEWHSWRRSLMGGNCSILFMDNAFDNGLHRLQIQTCYDTIDGEIFSTIFTFTVKNRK
jgi:hypothetical protein